LTTLESVNDFIATNRSNYEKYRELLADVPGVDLLDPQLSGENNFQYVVLEINQDEFRLSRDELASALWAENVLVRKYFKPGVHRMEPYRSFYPNAGLLLPVTEALAEKVLVLPTGTAVSHADISAVGQLIALAHEHSQGIRKLQLDAASSPM
jgi:dTDP-4-amino-4,6-dideoxygalactose transaminase